MEFMLFKVFRGIEIIKKYIVIRSGVLGSGYYESLKVLKYRKG